MIWDPVLTGYCIFNFNDQLLLYKNIIYFCILTLYTETLLNSIITVAFFFLQSFKNILHRNSCFLQANIGVLLKFNLYAFYLPYCTG